MGLDSKLYFLCGYLVDEFKEDVYKLVGCKVCDVYGDTYDLSIDEYNEYSKALVSEIYENGLLADTLSKETYFSKLSNVTKISKEFTRVKSTKSKNYFVYVDLENDFTSKGDLRDGAVVHINEVDRDICFKNKVIYKCSKVPIFNIEFEIYSKKYNRDLDVVISAYFKSGNVTYKPEGVDICDLTDEGYLDCYSITKDREKSSNYSSSNIITRVPIGLVKDKLDFIGTDGSWVYVGKYYCLCDDTVRSSLITPSNCEYLFNNHSYFGRGIEVLVLNPKFKGLVWCERKTLSDNIYAFFPDLKEVYMSKALDIKDVVSILCSFIRDSSKRTKDKLLMCVDTSRKLEYIISTLNYNFNSLINSKVNSTEIKESEDYYSNFLKIHLY